MDQETIRKSINWSLGIAVITLVLAAIFSIVSTFLLSGVTWGFGMLIVFAIILLGIFFDIMGVAATAADEVPFHAMASERIHGAKHAIVIVRNADRFSNFCNDVIGDISGIVSGTASAVVIMQIATGFGQGEGSAFHYILSIVFTSVVAALTVGGKSLGKTFAINYSKDIIFHVGKVLSFLEHRFKIRLLNDKSKQTNNKNKQNRKKK